MKYKRYFYNMCNWVRKNWALIFIVTFLFCCSIFLGMYKDDIYVSANDTLDSNIAYMHFTHKAFQEGKDLSSISSPILGGDSNTDRLFNVSFLSMFNILRLIYLLFDSFVAYCICFFIRILLGIGGWYALYRCIWEKEQTEKYKNLILIYGFIYGILPVWPMSLAVSAFPILLASIVFAYKGNSIKYSFLVLAFPIVFGGGLALYGCFVLGFLILFIIGDVIRNKRVNKGIVACFVLLLLWYVISEYSLIISVGSGGTIRTNATANIPRFDLSNLFHSIKKCLVQGIYHCGTNQQYFVVPICSIYFILSNLSGLITKYKKYTFVCKEYNILFVCYLLNGIIAGIARDAYGSYLIRRAIPILNGINLERFIWFNPLLLWLCLTILSIKLYENRKYILSYGVVWGTLFTVILGRPWLSVVMYNDLGNNIHWHVLDEHWDKVDDIYMTWKERMSETLFEKIKEDIDYQKEWSIAFGFMPSVLTYNEIYTLDGYDPAYSKEYSEQFTKLITPYLDNGEKYVDYYLESGIRAYVFSDELDYEVYREDFPDTDILIDINVFKEMNGKYIFSVVSITNSDALGLDLLGVYEDKESGYLKMYVYQVE